MPRFSNSNASELKEYIYWSKVHDAHVKEYSFDCIKKQLCIKIFNPIFNTGMSFVFKKVQAILYTSDFQIGSSEEISSLSVEDDFPVFPCSASEKNGTHHDSLYMMFQMFSGDELHVLCKELLVVSYESMESQGDDSQSLWC